MTHRIASPPALVIRLEIERRAVVYVDAIDEREALRLTDWLDTHEDYRALIDSASELTGRCSR